MRNQRLLPYVDTHTAGEATRIVHRGFPRPVGDTMAEQQQWMKNHADDLRRFVLQEPRGHRDMFGAVLSEPVDPTCQTSVFFMENGGYLGMCGHGSIGVATALVSLSKITIDPICDDKPLAGLPGNRLINFTP